MHTILPWQSVPFTSPRPPSNNDRLSFSPRARLLTAVNRERPISKGKRPNGTSFMDPSSVALSVLSFILGARVLNICFIL